MRPAASALDSLRARIAEIEGRPAFGGRQGIQSAIPEPRQGAVEASRRAPAQGAESDSSSSAAEAANGNALMPDPGPLPHLPGGLVHEIFTDQLRHGGLALGFALGLGTRQLDPARPALVHVQLFGEGQELGLPYAPGLARFGIGAQQLVMARVRTMAEWLWAVEEAIACRAVAGVLAEVAGAPKALDFTASRRLSLRAEAAGTSLYLIRYGTGREASASRLRWHVEPVLSGEVRWDRSAPGRPRFRIDIEKQRLGSGLDIGAEPKSLLLDWRENHGFTPLDPARRFAGRTVPGPGHLAPPPRAHAPPLGDGFSQAS